MSKQMAKSKRNVDVLPSSLEVPDVWRIIVCVQGCGIEAAKRSADRMSDEEQTKLREAFAQQVNVRAVLQSILDARADAAASSKPATASEPAT